MKKLWISCLLAIVILLSAGCAFHQMNAPASASPSDTAVFSPSAPTPARESDSPSPSEESAAPVITAQPTPISGIEYRNYQLGISLTFPSEWEGYYKIVEHANGFNIEFFGDSYASRKIIDWNADSSEIEMPWHDGIASDLTGAYGVKAHGIYLCSVLDYKPSDGETVRQIGEAYGNQFYVVGPNDYTIGALRDSDEPLAAEDFVRAATIERELWSCIEESFRVLEPADHEFRNERMGYAISVPASWTGWYRVREGYSWNAFDYRSDNEITQYRDDPSSAPIGLDFFYIEADYIEKPYERDYFDSIHEIGEVYEYPFYFCTSTDSSLSALSPGSVAFERMKGMKEGALDVAMTFRSLVHE